MTNQSNRPSQPSQPNRRKRSLRAAAATAGLALAALALSGATATTTAAASMDSTEGETERSAAFYQERAVELQAHVAENFGDAVPQATAVNVRLPAGEFHGDYSDDMGYLAHFVEFDDAIGHAGVALQYEEAGHYNQTPEQICGEWEPETCVIEELPDGSTLVTSTHEVTEEGRQSLTVHHFRTDSTVTWGTSYNYDPISGSVDDLPREDFPVTGEQLTELVTDPELTL